MAVFACEITSGIRAAYGGRRAGDAARSNRPRVESAGLSLRPPLDYFRRLTGGGEGAEAAGWGDVVALPPGLRSG